MKNQGLGPFVFDREQFESALRQARADAAKLENASGAGEKGMGFFRFIRDLMTGKMRRPVSEWFTVEFDSQVVRMEAEPPGRAAWSEQFRWSDIERVCFKSEDFATSDGVYVFTRLRPESYVIPIEAQGGQDFWAEVIERGLFDAELAIQAAGSAGGTFCWPEVKP
jgi:hypothetical protein